LESHCNAVTDASVQRGSLFYTLEVLRIRIVNPLNRGFLMYTWFCNMTVTKRNACSYIVGDDMHHIIAFQYW
jgi:hypothetical protein